MHYDLTACGLTDWISPIPWSAASSREGRDDARADFIFALRKGEPHDWAISTILPETRAVLPDLYRQLGIALSGSAQHSTTLRASPPREVSLYLSAMSAPVSRIVLIAVSRLT